MERRIFLGAMGAALVETQLRGSADHLSHVQFPISNIPSRLSRIGLELYSVRDAMKADPEGTLAKVKLMGYDDVELLFSFDNFGRTPEQVKATLAKEGLEAPSAHIAPETLLKDWQKTIDAARLLGVRYLIVPSLPAATNRSLDAWHEWADHFNNAGQVANKSGVWLAFHNEPGHQRPIEGKVPLDLFMQWTDPGVVRHQLDVGNMVMGGGDPMAYLRKYADRYWSFHLKDITADRKSDIELGKGSVNLKALLAAIKNVSDKPCYVEQEGLAHSLDSAAQNYLYLKGLDF